MAFPLMTVLTAAPGVISAAADIIRVIREKKKGDDPHQPDSEKLQALESLLEQQAVLIEELAVSHRDLALAVRNNRIISAVAMVIAVVAIVVAIGA